MVASNGRPATVECQSQRGSLCGSRGCGERRRRPAAPGTCAPRVQQGERRSRERHSCSPRDRNDERRPLAGRPRRRGRCSFAGSLIGCTGGPGGPADRSVGPGSARSEQPAPIPARSAPRSGPEPRIRTPARLGSALPAAIHARAAPSARPFRPPPAVICSREAESSAYVPSPRSPEPVRAASGAIMPRRRARRGRIEAECGGLLNR